MQQLLPQLPRNAAHSYFWAQTTKIKSQDRKPYALSLTEFHQTIYRTKLEPHINAMSHDHNSLI